MRPTLFHRSRHLRLALGIALAATLVAGCDEVILVEADTPAGAHLYEKHAREWLRWMVGQPYSTGPVTDPTGAACAEDQSGKVWYLAGTDGGPAERTCEIPEGKALFFPLVNAWGIAPEELFATPEELEEALVGIGEYFAANREATCTLMLTLDGEPFLETLEEHDASLWAQVLDPFTVEMDADNYAGLPAGEYPIAVIAGHWALLSPLPPGEHTLVFGGAQCEGEDISFETSVTYHLVVGEV